MNILITAGGTSEKIDDVRHLTNHATGSLGKALATNFQKQDSIHIYYIYGPKAVLPENKHIKFFPISSVQELEQQMKNLLTTITFDYVIHSMAVSDYELEVASNENLLAQSLASQLILSTAKTEAELKKEIANILLKPLTEVEPVQKKISSQSEKLILVMKKAPKVITQIKQWQPHTILIGFKLLVDVTEEYLISVAQQSIITNQADYILANDLIHIDGNQHLGLLVSSQGLEARFQTKQEIANGLTHLIITNKGKDD